MRICLEEVIENFKKVKIKILDNSNISIKFHSFVNSMVWIK